MSLTSDRVLRWILIALVLGGFIALVACTRTALPALRGVACTAAPTAAQAGQPLSTPTAMSKITLTKAQTPVPILYQFHDWGTDFRRLHPEWGPVGSVQMVTWERVNPGPGRYNWYVIDDGLKCEQGLTVLLRTGEVIPKPVVLEVHLQLSQYSNWPAVYYDCTPQWVYDCIDAGGDRRPVVNGRKVGYTITSCSGESVVIPMYDNPFWQKAYWDMVRALGQRYEGNPQVTAVVVTAGLDGETQFVRNWGCNLENLANTQARPLSYPYYRFVLETMRVYREAFPTKPLFINNCPGGGLVRKDSCDLAASLNPPIGIKNSGLWVDAQNHRGLGNAFGSWDGVATYSETVPIWLESAYGFGGPEEIYWSWFAGLHYHPVAMDVHKAFLETSRKSWLSFVQRHLGVTVKTTPDVWTMLRDSEFSPIRWGSNLSDGYVGKPGDWTFWMQRIEGLAGNATVIVTRKDLPEAARSHVYSRQARRTDQAKGNTMMSFNIDDRVWFAGKQAPRIRYKVVLSFLNHGSDTLSLEYMNREGQLVRKTVQ